ncbi:MAG: serine--tRNA ligase, partial [Cytophagia bacterium]|nr:serine--tRNA ligase [Cytophagia bacterium]
MLQVNVIREQRDKVIDGLRKRGLTTISETIDQVLSLDVQRKEMQRKQDDM